jgi:hypothetical protein
MLSGTPLGKINLVQRLGDGASDGFMHLSLPGESDLIFSWMDIDVYGVIRNSDKNSGHRKLPLDQSLGIAFKQCMLDDPVAHVPTVNVNIYGPGGTACGPG